MDSRKLKISPRAGPSQTMSAGESRGVVPNSAASCPSYYGGGTRCDISDKGKMGDDARAEGVATVPKLLDNPVKGGESAGKHKASGERERSEIKPSQGGKVVVGKAKELVIVLNKERTSGIAEKAKKSQITRNRTDSKEIVQLDPNSDESDASDASMETITSTCSMTSQGVKRRRDSGSGSDETLVSDEDKRPSKPGPSFPGIRRGRGRPPTTGKFVGLHKAKKKKQEEEWKAQKRQVERELMNDTSRFCRDILRGSGINVDAPTTNEDGDEDPTVARMMQQITKSVDYIREMTGKSKNLKGEIQGGIKLATQSIAKAVATLASHNTSEETRNLQAINARQASEIASLRKDIEQLRTAIKEMQAPPPPPPPNPAAQSFDLQAWERSMMIKMGTLVDARIEGRLLPEPNLRPPLAADRRRAKEAIAQIPPPEAPASARAPVASTSAAKPASYAQAAAVTANEKAVTAPKPKRQPRAPASSTEVAAPRANEVNVVAAPATVQPQAPATKGKKKKKKPKKKSMAARRVPDAEHEIMSSSPINDSEGWTRVRSKNAAKRERAQTRGRPQQRGREPQSRNRPQRPTKPRPQKLRAPRTDAVVLTLHPEAAERGATYEAVLAEAKKHISVKELGIADVRFRYAVTGAPIMVFPGADSAQKADTFAEKLRGVVDPSLVKVTRPVRTAELRVTELEVSVTSGEVAAAIAEAGDCDVSAVTCGVIRRDHPRRPGTAWVRCPVTVAKKVIQSKRLMIGWSSARLEVLPERPLRCFKCLERGHARMCCHAEIDRSEECYRCGLPGHKAFACSAKPHCTTCAAAGKKADHLPGRYTCAVPKRARGKDQARATAPQPAIAGPSGTGGQAEEEPMQIK